MTLYGRADLDGRLLEADPIFARLHQDAGGLPRGEIIVPQIAALVRLARDLGQQVQRPVLVADGGLTRELIGDAKPDAAGVDIVLRGWDNIAQPLPIEWHEQAQFDFARLEADGAWSADADLKMTRMAAGVGRDLGFLPATARGSGLAQIFRLLPDMAGELPILAALAKGQPFRDQPAELIPAGNRAVLLSAAQIYDEDGGFDGLIGSFTFVQPRLAARDVMSGPSDLDRILSERLEPALRRPLAKIIDHAEVAALQQIGPLRQDYVRYAGDIAVAARHLLDLLGDLANLQAIEAPDFRIETEPVDLADLLQRAAALMRVRAAEKQVQIAALPDPSHPYAAGDFGRLLQILVNLLSNAVR
ncbi:MAG: sensor histidine kinase [Chakrabartia sp.]